MDITQDQIAADKAAVASAQTAETAAEATLTTAEATLTTDEATFETEQSQEAELPELAVVDQLEALVAAPATGLSTDLQSQFNTLLEQIRSQLIASLTTAQPSNTPAPDASDAS